MYNTNKSNKIPEILNNAFSLAIEPRCGPVHINLPRDILSNNANFIDSYKNQTKADSSLSIIPKDSLLKAVDIILSSSQPVIIAGGGIKNGKAHQEVINLSKIMNIPIVSSAGHGDVIPFNQELYAGQMGPRGNPVASKLVREADVILALGTRLGFNSTFFSYENINKNASIIQVDVEKSALGRYFPITIGMCADAKIITKQ